ncbi:hypothetical protein ACFQL4_18745 [Halosimplex aquaticum]
MPGPTDRSPAAVVRDFFDGPEYEPLTAREIAAETEYSAAAVRDELDVLVDRDLLRTKELTGAVECGGPPSTSAPSGRNWSTRWLTRRRTPTPRSRASN